MIVNCYTLFDAQLQAYAQPFFSQTNGSALRAFADHVNEPGTGPNKHPEDYSLWHIGTFDDQEGRITPLTPTMLGRAAEYFKKA